MLQIRQEVANVAERLQMLKEIDEISFVVNDLILYLDTHPQDANALSEFSKAAVKRKQLLQEYANQYEPLTQNCICVETNNQSQTNTKYLGEKHFTWLDGPLPWEGGTF